MPGPHGLTGSLRQRPYRIRYATGWFIRVARIVGAGDEPLDRREKKSKQIYVTGCPTIIDLRVLGQLAPKPQLASRPGRPYPSPFAEDFRYLVGADGLEDRFHDEIGRNGFGFQPGRVILEVPLAHSWTGNAAHRANLVIQVQVGMHRQFRRVLDIRVGLDPPHERHSEQTPVQLVPVPIRLPVDVCLHQAAKNAFWHDLLKTRLASPVLSHLVGRTTARVSRCPIIVCRGITGVTRLGWVAAASHGRNRSVLLHPGVKPSPEARPSARWEGGGTGRLCSIKPSLGSR